VNHEFGRALQLIQVPHLRVLVVKSLTEPAIRAAFDDGFFVIELGEKATADNAQEVYEVVHRRLNEIFVGIVPERIRSAIIKLKEALSDLEGLA
jgi:hypothetical protein